MKCRTCYFNSLRTSAMGFKKRSCTALVNLSVAPKSTNSGSTLSSDKKRAQTVKSRHCAAAMSR